MDHQWTKHAVCSHLLKCDINIRSLNRWKTDRPVLQFYGGFALQVSVPVTWLKTMNSLVGSALSRGTAVFWVTRVQVLIWGSCVSSCCPKRVKYTKDDFDEFTAKKLLMLSLVVVSVVRIWFWTYTWLSCDIWCACTNTPVWRCVFWLVHLFATC